MTIEDLRKPDAPLFVHCADIAPSIVPCSAQSLRIACREGKMPFDCVITGSRVRIATASILAVIDGREKRSGHPVGAGQPETYSPVGADEKTLS